MVVVPDRARRRHRDPGARLFFFVVALFAVAGAAPGGMGELASLVWLVIIFGAVVVHELAHCVVGRPRGLVVHEIELLPIGGVSKLENLPENPRDELAMAIAGPAASAAIAVVAAVLVVASRQAMLPPNLAGGPLLPRIAWFNLVLAFFNLLPAFPLDGGRVLRAMLERRYDLERATHLAARAGRWVAVTLVVVGLLWNLWLVIIGFFVYLGATAEEAATIVHARLGPLLVADAMLVEPLTVDVRTSIGDVRALLRRFGQRIVPVVEGAHYVGMLDADAVVRAPVDARADELVDRDAAAVAPNDPLETDVMAMRASGRHAVAVVEDGSVVGLLRLEDVDLLLRTSAARESGRARRL